MAGADSKSSKRKRSTSENDPSYDGARTSTKKQKPVPVSQRLKGVPLFLHSENDHLYFSKPWWREMMAKDDFWKMLASNLGHGVQTRRIKISIDTDYNQRMEDLADAKSRSKRSAMVDSIENDDESSVNISTPVAPSVCCAECGVLLPSDTPNFTGSHDTVLCMTCMAAEDDGENLADKLESDEEEGTANIPNDAITIKKEIDGVDKVRKFHSIAGVLKIEDDDAKPQQRADNHNMPAMNNAAHLPAPVKGETPDRKCLIGVHSSSSGSDNMDTDQEKPNARPNFLSPDAEVHTVLNSLGRENQAEFETLGRGSTARPQMRASQKRQ